VVRNGQRYLKKTRTDALQQLPQVGRSPGSSYSPSDAASYMESPYAGEPSASVSPSYAQEFLKQTTLTH
jgi:hypothetical protein